MGFYNWIFTVLLSKVYNVLFYNGMFATLESGDSSVVTCWTVDQEVVVSNPTNGRKQFLSCARSPGLLSPFGEMSTGFRWPDFATKLGLKIRVYALRWLAVSVIVPGLGLKTIPDLLDTNSTHKEIAYAHLTAPHSCDYMDYVRHVVHVAKSSKNYLWLLGLEYAKCSLREKWNNAHILTVLSWPNGLIFFSFIYYWFYIPPTCANT